MAPKTKIPSGTTQQSQKNFTGTINNRPARKMNFQSSSNEQNNRGGVFTNFFLLYTPSL